MIYVEQTECEENGMMVYRKTVKLFGIPIYRLKSSYSASRLDRAIGSNASPIQPQYVEDDYE